MELGISLGRDDHGARERRCARSAAIGLGDAHDVVADLPQHAHSYVRPTADALPLDLPRVFDEHELELLIGGMTDIDMDNWTRFTNFHDGPHRFTIEKSGDLSRGHMYLNRCDLPPYEEPENLEAVLRLAIEETDAFGKSNE